MTREELYNLIKTKADDMRKSGRLKDRFNDFFKEDVEISRMIEWIKKVANCSTKSGIRKSFPDPNFTRQTVADETQAFYYTLDQMTGGKHNFLQKLMEQDKYIVYTSKGRSSCSTNPVVDAKGNETVEKVITICEEPLYNNRTVKAHECWHAMSEKDYNLSTLPFRNQFLGEIGTMAIDFMSTEFIKSLHPTDKDLCDKLSYLQNESKYNDSIDKSRDGYMDYLIGKILVGTAQEQSEALSELVDNVGKLWGLNQLEEKVKQIDAFVRDPKNCHYDPMYECRYVVASAIVSELRKSKISNAEKINKLAELNDHLITLNALDTKGVKSSWDTVTTHFGMAKMEDVITDFVKDIMKANTQTQNAQPQNSNTSSSTPSTPTSPAGANTTPIM